MHIAIWMDTRVRVAGDGGGWVGSMGSSQWMGWMVGWSKISRQYRRLIIIFRVFLSVDRTGNFNMS